MVVRGNNRLPIFFREEAKQEYMRTIACALEKFTLRMHAYAIMSNHAHLLLQVSSVPLKTAMHWVQSKFAHRQNWLSHSTGHLFEKRYWDSVCMTDSYLLNVLRYIHYNPVAAGIAAAVDDYPWTSHSAYLGVPHPLVTTELCLSLFGKGRSALEQYRAFMRAKAPAKWPHAVPNPFDEEPVDASPRFPAGLVQMLAEFAMYEGVAPEHLAGTSKERKLTALRKSFARAATTSGFTASETARVLNRARSVISDYLRE
ncbi:MAG: transposase [Elusimicrobia bacterium]|nr:transposase [Elusimicrobiota bacterium]